LYGKGLRESDNEVWEECAEACFEMKPEAIRNSALRLKPALSGQGEGFSSRGTLKGSNLINWSQHSAMLYAFRVI